jgi:hypothetical protein
MAARDRECRSGVGKFCREREAAVNERRQALDTAMIGATCREAAKTVMMADQSGVRTMLGLRDRPSSGRNLLGERKIRLAFREQRSLGFCDGELFWLRNDRLRRQGRRPLRSRIGGDVWVRRPGLGVRDALGRRCDVNFPKRADHVALDLRKAPPMLNFEP